MISPYMSTASFHNNTGLCVFYFPRPTSVMIFIVFDRFVCTSFIQPVQRIQLETGLGSEASGGEAGGGTVFDVVPSQHCPRQEFQLNTAHSLFHLQSFPVLFLISFLFFLLSSCSPRSRALISNASNRPSQLCFIVWVNSLFFSRFPSRGEASQARGPDVFVCNFRLSFCMELCMCPLSYDLIS